MNPLFYSFSLTLTICLSAIELRAQKNVIPVAQTQLLQLQLPIGSKQDKRLISVSAARLLLEQEAQKTGLKIAQTEVYYLPATGTHLYNFDTLVAALAGKGYEPAAMGNDEKFAWATNSGQRYLLYFNTTYKEANLYIGACTGGTVPSNNQVPATTTTVEIPIDPSTSNPQAQQPPIDPPQGNNTHIQTNGVGFHFNTSHFDDGWTSVEQPDWVQVSKNELVVLLHYGITFDDEMRNDALRTCWNRLAANRYQVISQKIFEKQTFDMPFYYMEADVQETATGKSLYIGFKVVAHNGVAYCMEVKAPNSQVLHATFPTHQSIEPMYSYNRFAVHANDLTGSWKSFSASAVQLYNIYTGGNAGMNYASTTDEFHFATDGTYRSKHMGAAGNYGSTTYYNNEYKGQYTANNWEISLTNRNNNQTENFHAYFEAVQGGRILHLTNKQYSGLTFKLVKSK